MRFIHVVGARPNFMKAAPVRAALASVPGSEQIVVHTGQHYDANMSAVFFDQLGIPEPDLNLAVGSGSHARQTAEIMSRFEEVVLQQRPDAVIVYGDVNSTIAAALVCAKLGVRIVHVEAGLRSFDRRMPEEINRLVTDQLADVLYTPSLDGNENLRREGVPDEKVEFVGNVMIDTLVRLLPVAEERVQRTLPSQYALLTLHRPSNVDEPAVLSSILETILDLSAGMDILFPMHPRTRTRILALGKRFSATSRLHLLEPAPYLESLGMQRHARYVLTDSGGIQEETTYLGVPCLTLRENTERPITVTDGTNVLVGHDMQKLRAELRRVLQNGRCKRSVPPLWDGHAAERIATSLASRICGSAEAMRANA
jgi:UDP-N-acetylglucosamine 2-epimerase (non-hydrolysing)